MSGIICSQTVVNETRTDPNMVFFFINDHLYLHYPAYYTANNDYNID